MDYIANELEYEWNLSRIDFLSEYGKYSRAAFIPRGSLSYMPDEWDDTPLKSEGERDWINSTPTDGFNRVYDKETGYWSFQCSLKNYERTIEYFFENVLGKIAENIVHLEYYYEEWTRSDFYDLVDGKIVQSKKEGIE
jgi:hypothetical protein